MTKYSTDSPIPKIVKKILPAVISIAVSKMMPVFETPFGPTPFGFDGQFMIPKGKKNNLPTLELGDSSKLELGQTVIAVGNALGNFRNTVSVGVASGLSREITAGDAATQQVAKLR